MIAIRGMTRDWMHLYHIENSWINFSIRESMRSSILLKKVKHSSLGSKFSLKIMSLSHYFNKNLKISPKKNLAIFLLNKLLKATESSMGNWGVFTEMAKKWEVLYHQDGEVMLNYESTKKQEILKKHSECQLIKINFLLLTIFLILTINSDPIQLRMRE